jgi:uncharacterized protein YjgD (DUF1641 family)
MAQPIPLTLAPRDLQHELNVRLDAASAEHAEAILAGYEVLQLMHDKGVLDLLRGTLGGGETVVQQAVTAANDPGVIRASRNALLLLQALGEIDPLLLSDLTRAIAPALRQANREQAKPPGLFKLLSTFLNPNFRRGLAACNDLLELFGKNLTNKGGSNAKQ